MTATIDEKMYIARAALLELPDVAKWSNLVQCWEEATSRRRPDWELPLLAMEAVTGQTPRSMTAGVMMAMVGAVQISIVLVDDIIDGDPRGLHNRLGVGQVANMALALQAASVRLLESILMSTSEYTMAAAFLSRMGLATAVGQALGNESYDDEGYWRLVRAKSTPFYAGALGLGVLAVHGDRNVALQLYELGAALGEMVQIRDDVFDAAAAPPGPDWNNPQNNIMLLYGMLAKNYPRRSRFLQLVHTVGNRLINSGPQERLQEEALNIIIEAGAVDYCQRLLVEGRRRAISALEGIVLANPAPIRDLIERLSQLGDSQQTN